MRKRSPKDCLGQSTRSVDRRASESALARAAAGWIAGAKLGQYLPAPSRRVDLEDRAETRHGSGPREH